MKSEVQKFEISCTELLFLNSRWHLCTVCQPSSETFTIVVCFVSFRKIHIWRSMIGKFLLKWKQGWIKILSLVFWVIFTHFQQFWESFFWKLAWMEQHFLWTSQVEVPTKWPLIRPSQTNLIFDQTNPDWIVHWLVYCALEAPWVCVSVLKTRSKTSSDQNIVRSKSPLIRLKCVRNSLIREWFEHNQISQYRYNILIF